MVGRGLVFGVLVGGLVVGSARAQAPTPTATPTVVPTPSATPTAVEVSPTAPVPTDTPSATGTAVVTPTATATLPSPTVPVATETPEPTTTETITPTATATLASPTVPGPTGTPTVTATAAITPTATATRVSPTLPVPTGTPTPTATRTFTPTATPIPSPTATPVRRPLIFIRSYRTDPSAVVAGSSFWLILELHNVGNGTAKNIVVTFVSETFVPVGTSSAKTVSQLTPDQHGMVGQNLKVNVGTASGTYPQVVQIDYEDALGNRYSTRETVGVTIIGAVVGQPQLVVERSQTQPPRFFPGSEFDLLLTLRNLGDRQARSILVTLASGEPFAPLGRGNVQRIARLDPDQVITVTLRLVVDREARPGAYNQGVTLEYGDPAGNRYTTKQTIGLVVAAERAERPLLMVLSYDIAPAYRSDAGQGRGALELAPGDVFTLNLEVVNVGRQRAHRVLISLGGGQTPSGQGAGVTGLGVFAPLESSNVKFVPQLDPEERRSISQRMAVDANAASGIYVLTVAFTYEDATGNSYTSSELISLLVIRRALLRIDLFQSVEDAEVGQEFSIPVEVINVGRNTVNVTTVEVTSEDLEVRDGVLYIGPLDPGTSGTLDARAVATRAGEARATVTVRYIDDFGRERLATRELSFRVKQPPLVELPDLAEEPGEESFLSRVWRFIRALLGLGG